MSSYKAKIGVILPAVNSVMRQDFEKVVPEGVAVYETRIAFGKCKPDNLLNMEKGTTRAAEDLGELHCDVQVYGCTSGSFVGGPEFEKNIVRQIEEAGNCKGITTSGAILKALEAYGVKKIAIATPYIDVVNKLEYDFFSANGYEITNITGLGYEDPVQIELISYDEIYNAAKASVTAETELLFISCTNYHSMDIVQKLEDELGIPVISSNQVSVWAALKACGIDYSGIKGYGKLFQRF